jgi:lipopolysaccharide exporter
MQQITDKIKHLISGDGLKARAMQGGFWLGLGSGAEQGLRFIRNIILVRILAPEAFGLMAIILVVNAAFESFTQIGIREAIIQNSKSEESTYLNGAWFMAFGRSILLFVIGIISSAWIASFYEIPHNTLLLQVSFAAILFNGAMSIRAYVSLKHMNYKQWAMIAHGGGLFGILLAISLSFIIQNVWALVFGFLTEAAARCILSFILCPYVPRWQFNKEHIKALLTYSRGMFGVPILYFIYAQLDIFVIGKLYPKSELGLYSMVASLAQAPSMIITTLINPIMMPVFSKKQNDAAWINRAIVKSTKVIMLSGIPLIFFAVFFGKDLLTIIYGSPYAIMAVPFIFQLSTTIMRSASVPIVNCYLAIGRPELHRLFTGTRAVLIIVLIYPAIKWLGLTGAALAVFFSTVVSIVPQIIRMHGLTGLKVRSFNAIIVEAMGLSCIVVLVLLIAKSLSSFKPIMNVIIGLTGCIFCYIITIVFIARKEESVFPE